MDSFEKISKMDLAALESPNGDLEEAKSEEVETAAETTETTDTANMPAAGEETDVIEAPEDAEEKEEKQQMMEPQGRHYNIDTMIGEDALVHFLFSHTYRQPMMILVTILGVVWPIFAIVKKQDNLLIPIVVAAFVLVWFPVSTYLKAKRAKKYNLAYQQEFHYMLDEWGLHLELGEDAIDVEWKTLTRLLIMKSVIVLYTGKNNAFLIPSAAIEDNRQEIISFIEEMYQNR